MVTEERRQQALGLAWRCPNAPQTRCIQDSCGPGHEDALDRAITHCLSL